MGRRVKNPPYVQEFTDRLGKPRWYFRRPGFDRVRLPGLPWSPEFMAAHEAALAGQPSGIGAKRTLPGSVSDGLVRYYGSEAFKELALATQKARRALLERFRAKHGEKRLSVLRADQVAKPETDLLPGCSTFNAKKNMLKAVRGFMAFCVEERIIPADPTAGLKLKRPRRKSSGFMTWREEQVEQYRVRHPIGTKARVALELLLNIAARRQDAFRLGRQHEKNGKLTWRPSKTARSTGKILTIRVLPELRGALDAMPPSDALTFITNDYGRPFASSAAFGNKFADWCVQAGLTSVLCEDGRTRNFRAHGLRKAACRQLAHDGCTALEIQAISGHATLAQLQVYIDEVEQERMAEAAMDKRVANARSKDKAATPIVKLQPEFDNRRARAVENA